MKKFTISTFVFGLFLSGCSVMHFKNGTVESAGRPQEFWHHNGIFTLVEFSPTVDLKTKCEGRNWSMVTTQLTFLTGLIGGVDDAVTSLFMPYNQGLNIWSPQDIELYCGDKASGSAIPSDTSKTAPKATETP